MPKIWMFCFSRHPNNKSHVVQHHLDWFKTYKILLGLCGKLLTNNYGHFIFGNIWGTFDHLASFPSSTKMISQLRINFLTNFEIPKIWMLVYLGTHTTYFIFSSIISIDLQKLGIYCYYYYYYLDPPICTNKTIFKLWADFGMPETLILFLSHHWKFVFFFWSHHLDNKIHLF